MRPLILLLLATPLTAADPEPKELLKRMVAAYDELRAIHMTASAEEVTSRSGYAFNNVTNFDYAANGKQRLRSIQKDGKGEIILISNGDKTWRGLSDRKEWSEEAGAPIAPDRTSTNPESLQNPRQKVLLLLIGLPLRFAQMAANPTLVRTESLKIGGRKHDCFLLRDTVNSYNTDLWLDRESFLAVQTKRRGKLFTQAGQADHVSTIRIKDVALGKDVPDSLFQFDPPAKWAKQDLLILPGEERKLLVNIAAPDFSLKSVNGSPIQLSSLRGKVVVLDFWASWCGPCQKSMPHLQKISESMAAKDVVVVGVSGEEEGTIKSFAKVNRFDFRLLHDAREEIHRRFGVNAFPTTFVIGKDGVIRKHIIGAANEEYLNKAVADVAR